MRTVIGSIGSGLASNIGAGCCEGWCMFVSSWGGIWLVMEPTVGAGGGGNGRPHHLSPLSRILKIISTRRFYAMTCLCTLERPAQFFRPKFHPENPVRNESLCSMIWCPSRCDLHVTKTLLWQAAEIPPRGASKPQRSRVAGRRTPRARFGTSQRASSNPCKTKLQPSRRVPAPRRPLSCHQILDQICPPILRYSPI